MGRILYQRIILSILMMFFKMEVNNVSNGVKSFWSISRSFQEWKFE